MEHKPLMKVFIVEDELLIRNSLRMMLTKYEQTYGIVYAGEASDGEIALSMMREIKPDILLTDIRMPFMDGLTLAKYAKDLFPWLHVIIISGYQDFPYLQEAISIGVEGYLTKPIHEEELCEVIQRARTNHEKMLIEQTDPSKQEKMIDFEYYKEHFFHKLKDGKYSTNELFDRQKRLNFTFIGKYFTILVARLTPAVKDSSLYHSLITRFSELFHADSQVLLTIFDDFTITGIIAGDRLEESLNKAYYVADILQYELHKYPEMTFLIGIGCQTNRVSELGGLLQKHEEALALTSDQSSQPIIELAVPSTKIPKEITDAFMPLLEPEHLEIPALLSEIEHLRTTVSSVSDPSLNQAILDTIFLWIKQVDEAACDDLQQEYTNDKLETICQTPTLFTLTSRLLLEELTKLKNQQKNPEYQSKTDKIVQQCVDYLKENYADPNLSLQSLADHLNISPAYLSTIFSQNKQVTFIEYLTCIRMEQAKKLLVETNHKIIDITFFVGYNDPNYFSFTFKKRNGLSPKEFRKTAKNDNEDH
ncbi:DNA-binding response regulator [Enterococcus florum]|uniref:DNA-binding response regulator n=1 Tax=Enterococcus florum TaxID=2480627 RepID=A0A4P5PB36_9ENTE|nr:response regulator [Enterococcus florum]GCF92652.1 DNA-binding response regulator [Enterococcus florum]